VVGHDIEVAIGPLQALSGLALTGTAQRMLRTGRVREMTGLDAQQGLWAQVSKMNCCLIGLAGSVITQAATNKI